MTNGGRDPRNSQPSTGQGASDEGSTRLATLLKNPAVVAAIVGGVFTLGAALVSVVAAEGIGPSWVSGSEQGKNAIAPEAPNGEPTTTDEKEPKGDEAEPETTDQEEPEDDGGEPTPQPSTVNASVSTTPAPSTTTASAPDAEVTRSPSDPVEAVQEAVKLYYWAVDSEDWTYTYNNLDSRTKNMFDYDEWSLKNQWFADANPAGLVSLAVEVPYLDPSGTYATASVTRVYEAGSQTFETVFVYEEGSWKHRLVGNEIQRFMPEASYEDFKAAQQ